MRFTWTELSPTAYMGLRLVEWLFCVGEESDYHWVPRTATDVPFRYYESNGISIPSPQPSASSKRDDAKLDQMFDDLRGKPVPL
jgi:hypothetical protein